MFFGDKARQTTKTEKGKKRKKGKNRVEVHVIVFCIDCSLLKSYVAFFYNNKTFHNISLSGKEGRAFLKVVYHIYGMFFPNTDA